MIKMDITKFHFFFVIPQIITIYRTLHENKINHKFQFSNRMGTNYLNKVEL